jgi:spore germination protein
MNLFTDINKNIQRTEEQFENSGDFIGKRIPAGSSIAYVAYFDLLADRKLVELNVVTKIMYAFEKINDDAFEKIKDDITTTIDLKEETTFEGAFRSILSGDALVFVDRSDKAIIISAKGFPNRGVPKAETEVVVQGSQEAFSEAFRINTALIRRRVRDANLKIKQLQVGRRSVTDIGIIYLEGVAREEVVNETETRLKNIDVDAILDSGYIEQFIEDDWISPFPQIQTTERPDKAAAAVFEGRVVILVDNSPFALIVPATIPTFFQSSEDYYRRFHVMTATRILRYGAGFLAAALPGLYVAVTVFHPSMLPTSLAVKMAQSRADVPFPCIVETLLMDVAFELLKEAGIRLPGAVGSAIGIVGGIIVGQAAVEAGLVSPNVVIIVALTAIASFAIPNYSLVSGFRFVKYVTIILSSALGFLGFWCASILTIVHLCALKSFGMPYMFPFAAGGMNGYSDLKDSVFRAPLWLMKKRPFFANPKESIRMNKTGKRRGKD